jgi:putative membrane protein
MDVAHGAHDGGGGGAVAWMFLALGLGGVVTVYVVVVRAYARRRARTWSPGRLTAFLVGALLVVVALSPAVDRLGHDDPRWHMVQHLLLGMVAPLALVLSAPMTLVLGACGPAGRRRLGRLLAWSPLRVLTTPLVAAVLSSGALYVVYLTPVYALSTQHAALHHLLHLHFLLAGYAFTWAIIGPDPAPRRPGMVHRVAVLVLAAGAHAHVAKLIYARASGGVLPSAHDDAALWREAAEWMYYGGDVVELLIAGVLFTLWYAGRLPGARRPVASGAASPRAQRA